MVVAVVPVRDQLCEIWIGNGLVLLFVFDVDIVEANKIQKIRVVDHAQTEQLANAWLRHTVFQLGQPAIGNAESLVAFGFSNSPACLFDIANGDAAPITQRLEHLASGQSSPRNYLPGEFWLLAVDCAAARAGFSS